MGLLYEPLFLYNPITIATSRGSPPQAAGPATTYVIAVRNGVKWSDGSSLTGADVAYSINLAKTNPAVAL